MPKLPQAAAPVITSQVHRDFEQPYAYTRFAPKRSSLLVRFQKALLGQCLRCVGVANHAQQNSIDALLVRLYKRGKVIECSHSAANLSLNWNQNGRLPILHHVRSSFHQDELANGKFT
jgi:hypothetical protein